jgi:hypothetical protein
VVVSHTRGLRERPNSHKNQQFDKYLQNIQKILTKRSAFFILKTTKFGLAKPSMVTGTSKQERFRGLAEKRTNKALDAILRIGNLSNRQIYEYDESEVRKIAKALRDAINTIESRFESSKGRAGGGFKL